MPISILKSLDSGRHYFVDMKQQPLAVDYSSGDSADCKLIASNASNYKQLVDYKLFAGKELKLNDVNFEDVTEQFKPNQFSNTITLDIDKKAANDFFNQLLIHSHQISASGGVIAPMVTAEEIIAGNPIQRNMGVDLGDAAGVLKSFSVVITGESEDTLSFTFAFNAYLFATKLVKDPENANYCPALTFHPENVALDVLYATVTFGFCDSDGAALVDEHYKVLAEQMEETAEFEEAVDGEISEEEAGASEQLN